MPVYIYVDEGTYLRRYRYVYIGLYTQRRKKSTMPVGRDTFRMVATQNNMLQHGPPTSLVATNNSILPEADLEDHHFCPRFSIVFPVAWSSAVLRPILSVLSSRFCRSPYPSLRPLHAPAKVFQPCKRWDNSLEWRGQSVRT